MQSLKHPTSTMRDQRRMICRPKNDSQSFLFYQSLLDSKARIAFAFFLKKTEQITLKAQICALLDTRRELWF
jgi:hypothetical protein